MKKIFFIMGVLFLFSNIQAQKMMRLSSDTAVLFGELGTVVIFDEELKIAMDIDHSKIDEGYKLVDLKEGDLVLYANGKKVTTIKELRKIYEETEIGEQMKLGIQRGEDRMIVTFLRSDKMASGFKIQRKGGH